MPTRYSKISIIPRGFAGGYTKTLDEDREYETRSYIEERLAMAWAAGPLKR